MKNLDITASKRLMKFNLNFFKFIFILSFIFLSFSAFAQKVELNDDPQTLEVNHSATYGEPVKAQPTGKKAAQKFFTKSANSSSSFSSDDHFLMVGIGAFFNSKAYDWGSKRKVDDPGEFNAGVTYRFGEWSNSMDFMGRLEYQTFDVDSSQNPKKLSFMPMVFFPDARSGFPLYFGAGIGAGIFMDQPKSESSLSLDYQLVIGGRMLNVFNSVGFFVETGLKNHILLLSSGQFDGVFITFGSVFTF